MMRKSKTPMLSLKARLAAGAAILSAGTILTALTLYLGLNEVAQRLDAAVTSETRVARYSTLSTQAATFLVVASEAVQTGMTAQTRMDRITPVTDQLRRTFTQLHRDVEQAVFAARSLGVDAQSRYGTQSLGLARMEALLGATLSGLAEDTDDTDRLRAHIDTFAAGLDSLLSQAVNTELLFRNNIMTGIGDLRLQLTRIALAIVAATLLAVAVFYLGLIRPQFNRLDRLRRAATQIGQGDFDVALPVSRLDEIGQLSAETNRMARALLARREDVQAQWDRLNDTIAQRTEALRSANAALEEIDDKRRRFFADISHELRTPLTVILMEAQIGKTGSPDPAAAFATIEARAARLNRRIDDLLRLARSDTGQLALDPDRVMLCDLTEDVASEVQAEVDNAGMTLNMDAMPDVAVYCDRNWVRQVLVSLLRNSIRHARAGRHIHVSPELGDDHAGVSVTDNGGGIPAKDQASVFDRFSQGNSATANEGFGVGLALAHWVITEQNGSITLTSPVPVEQALGDAPGTKIAVCLPRHNT
ncbi:sensor histidine kinase [Roseobacter denitrificans]|nr:HAMP domain-containing sensor histidine kinase [Roseobacter denitrificans]